jgi:enterochelin esterase-like enzyme
VPPERRRRRPPPGVLVGLVALALAVPALLGLLVERLDDEPLGAHFRSTLGARIGRFELVSRAAGRKLQPVVVQPASARDGDRRPLLLLLHAHGMPPEFFLSDGFFEGLRAAGDRAPVVALLDGTPAAPWHDRRDGAWGRMVTDEAIPAVARRLPVDTRRVAIGGISLGGFGALDLASLHPRRFCAAGGHSPALWPRATAAPRGLFDSPAAFARHDVLARARRSERPFGATAVWLDRGDADPYRATTDRLARALAAGDTRLTVRRFPGGHDRAYWDAHIAEWVAFYARALSRCRTADPTRRPRIRRISRPAASPPRSSRTGSR